MRNAFADEIEKLAAEDPRIILLSGDIGNRLFDKFKARFPDRFYNCGVAEANMINMAAGLAMTGLRPVVYTIASFLVYRPYEQIRLNLGYHDLPVTLVGVGGGLSYASNGPSHHALDDIGVIQSVPNFQIMNAGDAWEVRAGLRASLKSSHPCYLRIGKKREPVIHKGELSDFDFGRSVLIRKGTNATVLASGTLLPNALIAAEQTGASLVSFPSINPLDTDTLVKLFSDETPIIVVEEHSEKGGLGAAITQWARTKGLPTVNLHLIATPASFLKRTTHQEDARDFLRLSKDPLTKRIQDIISSD